MKKHKIVVLLAILTFSAIAYSQSDVSKKVPQNVKNAFKAKFPAASHLSWVKEPNANYEAKFVVNETRQRAEFDAKGNWVETENNIQTSALPQSVKDEMAKKNPACKISEAEEVETAYNGKEYDVGCMVNAAKKEYRVAANGTMEKEIEKK